MQMNDYKGAADAATQALSSNSSNFTLRETLPLRAKCYLKLKQNDKAVQDLMQISRISAFDRKNLVEIEQTLHNLGREKERAEVLKRIKDMDNDMHMPE
jgi:tetratricopeptide (TPR) repeat protein